MTPAQPHQSDPLQSPLQFLKGVGPQRAEQLARLKLLTASDLLFYFPRDYQQRGGARNIADLIDGESATITATIEEIDQRNTGPGRSMLGVLVQQDRSFLRALWFNQPHMRRRFAEGQQIVLSGKPERKSGRWQMVHPHFESAEGSAAKTEAEILPVYSLTEGISQHQMRQVVDSAIEHCADQLPEVLPESFRTLHNLPSIQDAVKSIHRPADDEQIKQAKRRFVFQELLVWQLALALRRHQMQAEASAAELPLSAKIDGRIRKLLPFRLTDGQDTVISEIASDMGQTFPMNRLLQGDVGSGKTVVAAYAMLLAIAHRQQAVLMAPTDVLARQHMQTFAELLKKSSVRSVLLTGTQTAGERRESLEAITSGEADLVVGTQAIVQSGVEFSRLGLVVIDEQHKFGVRHRAFLRQSGQSPHYLVMTATPIPRSIAMTAFGDLSLSILQGAPDGRQEVHTYQATADQRDRWWDFFRRKLREGRQGYVITPLVDAGEDSEALGLEQAFEALANGPLEEFRLDLLHGRMTGDQKIAAMEAFRDGTTQVLVATTVVEVGIDVPNATMMAIENAERFGLAQLHQLRGRVSRGKHAAYVCVFSESENPQAIERIGAFCESNDGFALAELDYRQRGSGDLLGTRQSGMPELRIANPLEDSELVELARDVATQLVTDGSLDTDDFSSLQKMVLRRYGHLLQLGDVG